MNVPIGLILYGKGAPQRREERQHCLQVRGALGMLKRSRSEIGFIRHHARKVAGLPRSRYRAGVKGWIVGGTEQTVFLGESLSETKLPEFTVLDECGGQSICQYGRDIIFP